MPLVVIAGGTSKSLGRSITQAIITAYPDGKWKPIILSRSDKPPSWASKLPRSSFEIRKVDYSSPSSLDAALKGSHTVISVILGKDETHVTHQISLLEAAVRAGVKRFVPSDWASPPAGTRKVTMLNMAKPPVWEACERSNIQWARFNVGMFMNYLGIGCSDDKEVEEKACAGVDREGDMPDGSGAFLISLSSATAEIPMREDGGYPGMTFTEIDNVGEFVAAALELESWETDMNIVGSNIRFDELLELCEEVRGKKFVVTPLAKSGLEKEISSLESPLSLKQLWLELKLQTATDIFGEVIFEPVVNSLCPQVKAVDVETYLRKYWMK